MAISGKLQKSYKGRISKNPKFLLTTALRFPLQNDSLGLKMKILKFLGIESNYTGDKDKHVTIFQAMLLLQSDKFVDFRRISHNI